MQKLDCPGSSPKARVHSSLSAHYLHGSESFSNPPDGRRPTGTLHRSGVFSGSAISKHLNFQKVIVLLAFPLPPLKIADALRRPRIITEPPHPPKMINFEMQFAEV